MSNDKLRVTPVAFFIVDFNLSSWESENVTFFIKLIERVSITFTVPCEKSKTLSLTFFADFLARYKFTMKLISDIAFGSALSACYLLRSNANIL